MKKIMFVCHGNICRSPMAEYVFLDMVKKRGLSDVLTAESSATSTEEIGNDIHHGTKRILDKYSIPYRRREATQLSRSDYAKYDLFVGMDSANIRNMYRILGDGAADKIYKMMSFVGSGEDVADPWFTGGFAATYADCFRACLALLDLLEGEK